MEITQYAKWCSVEQRDFLANNEKCSELSWAWHVSSYICKLNVKMETIVSILISNVRIYTYELLTSVNGHNYVINYMPNYFFQSNSII